MRIKESPLSIFLRSKGVDVYFGMFLDARDFKIPTLSWIPDFQHLHLPEMFDQQEISGRTATIIQCCENATHLIVSSETARKDLISLVPAAYSKTTVLRFVAQVADDVYRTDPSYIGKKYNLPLQYFYLPNNSGSIRNHDLVIEASITFTKAIGKSRLSVRIDNGLPKS